jgi:hypothetical protein
LRSQSFRVGRRCLEDRFGRARVSLASDALTDSNRVCESSRAIPSETARVPEPTSSLDVSGRQVWEDSCLVPLFATCFLQTYKLSSSEVLAIWILWEDAARTTAERRSLAEWFPSGTLRAYSPESPMSSLNTCSMSSRCLPRRWRFRVESGTLSTVGVVRTLLIPEFFRALTNPV